MGRFINRDPIAESGGLNLYGFCGNNGVNGYDLLGMDPASGSPDEVIAFNGGHFPRSYVAQILVEQNSHGQGYQGSFSGFLGVDMGPEPWIALSGSAGQTRKYTVDGKDYYVTNDSSLVPDGADVVFSGTAGQAASNAATATRGAVSSSSSANVGSANGTVVTTRDGRSVTTNITLGETQFLGVVDSDGLTPIAPNNTGPNELTPIGQPTGALQNGKSVTYYFDDGHYEVWSGGSRAWRNNNPGNLRNGSIAKQNGSIGAADKFAVFPDYQTGYSALLNLLVSPGYKNETIGSFLNKYAPSSENDTGNYRNFLQRQTGLPGNLQLGGLNSGQLNSVGQAIQKMEGYNPGTIQSFTYPTY